MRKAAGDPSDAECRTTGDAATALTINLLTAVRPWCPRSSSLLRLPRFSSPLRTPLANSKAENVRRPGGGNEDVDQGLSDIASVGREPSGRRRPSAPSTSMTPRRWFRIRRRVMRLPFTEAMVPNLIEIDGVDACRYTFTWWADAATGAMLLASSKSRNTSDRSALFTSFTTIGRTSSTRDSHSARVVGIDREERREEAAQHTAASWFSLLNKRPETRGPDLLLLLAQQLRIEPVRQGGRIVRERIFPGSVAPDAIRSDSQQADEGCRSVDVRARGFVGRVVVADRGRPRLRPSFSRCLKETAHATRSPGTATVRVENEVGVFGQHLPNAGFVE